MDSTTEVGRLPVSDRGCLFCLEGLYKEFQELVDQRKPRGKRYSLALVLLLVVVAKLCGEDHPSGIAEWVQARAKYLVAALQLSYERMPCHNTFRRVLRMVDPGTLQRVLARYLRARSGVGRDVLVTMDGKTLRGTLPAGQNQGVHLLAVFAPHESLVLVQVAVDSKENEITAAPQVLQTVDLSGKVVVADAMHCQRELSVQVVRARGHYIWLAKDNQPHTRQAIADLFELPRPVLAREQATAFRSVTTTNKGHGRLEKRTLTASEWLNGYLHWPHLGQVFRLERQFTKLSDGSEHRQVVYGLTDLTQAQASPSQLLNWIREYWGIENKLHYWRGKTLREDATRMTHSGMAQVMATINNLIIKLTVGSGWRYLPTARRHYDGNPQAALSLILCQPYLTLQKPCRVRFGPLHAPGKVLE